MWKMINETNAIQAMGISFRFTEPLSAMVAKRILKELDTPTNRAGLLIKQPLQGLQVNIANPAEIKPISGLAMLFQKSSIVRAGDNNVENQITSQLEFQPTHINYQLHRYSRWQSELATLKDLIGATLASVGQATGLAAIRLEYLDRFYFSGEPTEARVGDILRADSGWLAPHVFSANDLWHSHTGRFEDITPKSRTLLGANADFQDLTGPSDFAGKRSVQLMTFVEYQYFEDGLEMYGEILENLLDSTLGELHTRCVHLFKAIVTEDFRKEHGLPHD